MFYARVCAAKVGIFGNTAMAFSELSEKERAERGVSFAVILEFSIVNITHK